MRLYSREKRLLRQNERSLAPSWRIFFATVALLSDTERHLCFDASPESPTMVLIRTVHAPALLVKATSAMGMTQRQLGEAVGVSRRTVVRWHTGQSGPSINEWRSLAVAAYAKDPALAQEIATEIGETLVSLGVEAPAAPIAVPARPAPSLADLVDSVVCAAAEAIGATPQAVRPALLAAFDRTASVGLTLDDVRGVLTPPAKTARAKKAE
jgi:transcriptional regulator with XRE-family HTH domain